MIGKTISHYKITEELGCGGMGLVYKALDLKLKRKIAIKFLPPEMTRNLEAKKRFIREAQMASALDHPNICTIHEIDETDDGQLFIVMACYEGKTLREKINACSEQNRRETCIEIKEIIDIAIQVAQGLSAAHNAEIVHRDIKPENIVINMDHQVKILDFGLAKLKGLSYLTQESSTLGTTKYMSPEQIHGKNIDHRTDIWSYGVLMYELLTGQLPFKGDYDQAVIYSILNENPESVNRLRADVPMALEKLVNKCLRKNLSQRYQHIDDIIVDLKRLKEQYAAKTSQVKLRTIGIKRKFPLLLLSVLVCILLYFAIKYVISFKPTEAVDFIPERKMLVVLPFKNLGLPDHEYFTDGITEEITSRLSEIKQLGVICRTSADRYKNTEKSIEQIGKELGVDYLLEGSVRWENLPGLENRIRVTPQLIKVSDETHMWTKRYDAILESVFDVQSDIAEKVAQALDITLLGTEQKLISQKPTENLEAYDCYLRGNNYFNQRGVSQENLRISEKMFLKAIGLDSNFVFSYLRLAQINITYYWYHWDRSKNRLADSKYFIDKAKEINPDIPEIYIALGQYYYQGLIDYDKALFELENGLKIYPDNSEILEWIGYIKRRQGKFERSIEYLLRSAQLNPGTNLNMDIGLSYLLLKKYELAEKYMDLAISNLPEWGEAYYLKAKIHICRNGDIDRAYQIINIGLDIAGHDNLWLMLLLVEVRIFQGRYDEALKLLSDNSISVFDIPDHFEPKSKLLATIYDLQNKNDLAKAYYDSARALIASEIKKLPKDARLHSAHGIVLAELGKKADAINEGKRATKLLPVEKEAMRGFLRELDLAKIYTVVGEYDLAIDKLEYLISIPGELSVPYLKLDPVWRPLSNIPRFKKLLEKNK